MRGSLKLLSSNGPKFRFNHEAYLRDFQNAKSNSESFWLKKSEEIEWQTRPSMPLDGLDWFPDGKLSTAFNCLDRHVRKKKGGTVSFLVETKKKKRFAIKEAEWKLCDLILSSLWSVASSLMESFSNYRPILRAVCKIWTSRSAFLCSLHELLSLCAFWDRVEIASFFIFRLCQRRLLRFWVLVALEPRTVLCLPVFLPLIWPRAWTT